MRWRGAIHKNPLRGSITAKALSMRGLSLIWSLASRGLSRSLWKGHWSRGGRSLWHVGYWLKGKNVRIVTEEEKDTPRKMSLSTAAGLLRLPSVPLKALLDFEEIDP